MFFDLVSRNSKRNRKENGLFFSSLLISIIAFYLILSLSNQEVMRFLVVMESDAVEKLLQMIPLFYILTLFILFFLIYFASKYQLERRMHEMGIYLMLGMKRYKLFFLLLFEDMRNSCIALFLGLPIGIAVSELISLVTVRLVGLGMVGHRLTISWSAIGLTALGFFLIKLIAFILLSGKISQKEIGDLLAPEPEGTKKSLPYGLYFLSFFAGVGLLAVAYGLSIQGAAWNNMKTMAMTLMAGFVGILCLFYGLRAPIGNVAKRTGKNSGLHVFTFRQLQEMVVYKSNTMAITSLLMLAGLCCFGGGTAIAIRYGTSENHTIDYTFSEEMMNAEELLEQLEVRNVSSLFSHIIQVKTGYMSNVENAETAVSLEKIEEKIKQMPATEDTEILLNNLEYMQDPYLISLTSYNALLTLAGQETIVLQDKEAAVYMDHSFWNTNQISLWEDILESGLEIGFVGENYHLVGGVYQTNLVVDRAITLSFALIVKDEVFEQYTGGYDTFTNAVLSPEQTEGKSLIEAVLSVNEKLDAAGFAYESYLQNIGRQLFYVVAASYIFIYLAIVFFIIANTVIGVQFLTLQQKTKHRYATLIRIGAGYEVLCASAKKQIVWFFTIPLVVAAVNSIFGIRGLFSGVLSRRTSADILTLLGISAAMIFVMCMIEYMYMRVVIRSSNRFLLTLLAPEWEE